MDPLAEIQAKLDGLPDTLSSAGLKAVLRHLELAEAHYDRARADDDDDYFNDAVYRANQAYEGALREAWRVLRGRDPKKMKTLQLEKGLTNEGVLTDRARGLLENYRQQWRNPSTHDHTVLFGQQDSFLAIWSVIAFASVLLDQIVTVISEAEAAKAIPTGEAKGAPAGTPADDYLPLLFQAFAEQPTAYYRTDGTPRSEAETIGWLSGFLKKRLPDIVIEAHPRLQSGVRPDLLVKAGSQEIVVELKRGPSASSALDGAAAQVLRYMSELDLSEGVLLVAPHHLDAGIEGRVEIFEDPDGRLKKVFVIAPGGSPDGADNST